MSRASHAHVPSVDVLANGAPLDPAIRRQITEVIVKDSLVLPASAVVRISDPKLENMDSHPLQLGVPVEIKLGSMGDSATQSVFKGTVVALEPEFMQDGAAIVVRALADTHKLFRNRRARTFQDVKASDMVQTILSGAGLSAGTVDTTSVVHKYFHQAGESDWEFLNRLALDNDREVVADGTRVHFRKAGEGSGTPVTLAMGVRLLNFRPRMSGVQQVQEVEVRGWDAAGKRPIVGTHASGTAHAEVGKARSAVSSALNGGKVLIADRTVDNQTAAREIAKSALNRVADSFVEAEGTCLGEPKVKAGAKVKIENVGTTFGGTYVVTASTHSFRGGTGYQTSFTISGRSPRTLLDLMRPPEKREWGSSFVVGVVTNNNDPDQMGRVKVKLPSLGDNHESHWARVVTPSAGPSGRGIFMLPQPDEEVVVGFENGDAQRPYVIGSVFNGRDKPGADLLQNRDGSFAMKSDEKIWVKSAKDIEIRSDQKMLVEISQDITEKAGGNYTNEATGNTKVKAQQISVEAGGSLTIKGVSVTVEASASLTLKGPSVTLQGSGPVQIKGTPISIG